MTDASTDAQPRTVPSAGLKSLDRRQIGVFRVQAMIAGGVPLIAVLAGLGIVRTNLHWPLPYTAILVLLLAFYAVWVLVVPGRRYRHWGYHMGGDAIRIAAGFVFRIETVVPFARVQHIDVSRGPVERMFGVSTLILHTAGSYNSTVRLPGLAPETAVAMREHIRAEIREERP